MGDQEQYRALIAEIISKQSVILGPDMAVATAQNVQDLNISDDGRIVEIKGEAEPALKALVDAYVALSGQIVKNAMDPLFKKYPNIKQV